LTFAAGFNLFRSYPMPVYCALRLCFTTLMVAISLPMGALAADLTVLSAGAIEPGIQAAAADWPQRQDHVQHRP
jgi:hypothetical protein